MPSASSPHCSWPTLLAGLAGLSPGTGAHHGQATKQERRAARNQKIDERLAKKKADGGTSAANAEEDMTEAEKRRAARTQNIEERLAKKKEAARLAAEAKAEAERKAEEDRKAAEAEAIRKAEEEQKAKERQRIIDQKIDVMSTEAIKGAISSVVDGELVAAIAAAAREQIIDELSEEAVKDAEEKLVEMLVMETAVAAHEFAELVMQHLILAVMEDEFEDVAVTAVEAHLEQVEKDRNILEWLAKEEKSIAEHRSQLGW